MSKKFENYVNDFNKLQFLSATPLCGEIINRYERKNCIHPPSLHCYYRFLPLNFSGKFYEWLGRKFFFELKKK